MSHYDFVAGDTGSAIEVTCKDGAGAPIDLAGATVRLIWVDSTGALQQRGMTVSAPASNGIARYTFVAADLDPGYVEFSFRITDASGKELSSLDVLTEHVRARQVALV